MNKFLEYAVGLILDWPGVIAITVRRVSDGGMISVLTGVDTVQTIVPHAGVRDDDWFQLLRPMRSIVYDMAGVAEAQE